MLGSRRRTGIPLHRKIISLLLIAIPCIALTLVLHFYLMARTGPGAELSPDPLTAMIPVVYYLILSSMALMIGAILSWPLRVTLKVHTVAGVLVIFLALITLINAESSLRFILGVTLLSGLLSTLAARWQDAAFGEAAPEPESVPASRGAPLPGEQTSLLPQTGADMFPSELAEKYSDIRYIGSGGLARVFYARNRVSGSEVALKIPIQADENTGKCFMKEIIGWEDLQHPNIVEVSGVNILPIPYVEMEYLPGTLAGLPRPMDTRSAALIALSIARGLAFAHGKGIIHRDIKPQNILISPDGVPKISDWGMSKVMGVCRLPTIAGFSLGYAAPEQVAPLTFGDTDQRTDLYQLGCLLYELVTGHVPFPGTDIVQVSSRIANETPALPSSLNPSARPLDAIIMKCLEKEPESRYQNAQDLIRDLESFLSSGDEDRYNIFED